MSNELRVLYLTQNSNLGSTARPLTAWFQQLRPRGLQPVLVSHRAGPLQDWALAQGIPAYEVSLPFPSKTWPWPFLRSLWRLRRLVRQYGIQLIHCNEHDFYPIAQYLGRLCQLPVVVTVNFTMNAGFCQWAFGGRRRPSRIFFTSRGSLEICRPALTGVVEEKRWRLHYHALDLEHYRPDANLRRQFRTQLGLDGELLIGAACAQRPVKQLEHLFEAAAHLPPHVRVVLAGSAVPGDEAYARHLLEQARARLGPRFIFLGLLDELRGLCNALDLYVNTSREESFGLSVLEALACGCPVLGYASKAVDELVLPDGGEIVPQDDVAALTDALARWVANPRDLAKARLGARRRAESDYDTRARSQQLWDEYQEILRA